MAVSELLECRDDILEDSKDDNGFIHQNMVLSHALPFMLDAKLIDSEDYSECYYFNEADNLKLNGYTINDSGERLQLFIVDENSILENDRDETLYVSNRADYEAKFRRASNVISSVYKNKLTDLQDSDPIAALVSHIGSISGIQQFDVVEIFLITLTATISRKSNEDQPRQMHFQASTFNVEYQDDDERKAKEILLVKSLVDLNFLHNVIVSRGNRQPLIVNFKKTFGYEIEVIEAAKDKNFESYLCVLRASVLADLYRQYSSRLLEKNVRSFLQFRGVNRGIKETIRKEPEKFIAYNNGLTLTATSAKINLRKKNLFLEELEDLQIVNGGQTTASIYFSKKEGVDISNVKVMAKINVVNQADDGELDDLISNISKYSNTQSRVSNVDLRSRSPQLVQLKQLSESVVTPSGTKWFFERSRGEFNTKLRIAGSNAAKIRRDFPSNKRFTKAELAKYYCAWGNEPYIVKRGGEKVFRYFIEEITPNENYLEGSENSVEPVVINRDFYESLIAKIIIFRKFEKIYGQGKNSMGQLRSAAIPYALSILYSVTDGAKSPIPFNFLRIWKEEEISAEFEVLSSELLILTNKLIKKYAASDDFGEYSKKPELWANIRKSTELKKFLSDDDVMRVIGEYTVK